MGRKVSDRFTVPLCRLHHRELSLPRQRTRMVADHGIDPLAIAARLWAMTHAVEDVGASLEGARTLVHKPDWIFMDEATSALDEAGQENIMKLLIEELPETSIVSIGHRPGLEVFHTRELTLVPGEAGARLRTPEVAASALAEGRLSPHVGGEPQPPAHAGLLEEARDQHARPLTFPPASRLFPTIVGSVKR